MVVGFVGEEIGALKLSQLSPFLTSSSHVWSLTIHHESGVKVHVDEGWDV